MMSVQIEYDKLLAGIDDAVSASQMFGKACLKIHGKAFVAQHKDTIVFKLVAPEHTQALALLNAVLWDPSGKGRPMKQWVALPMSASDYFQKFYLAALKNIANGG